MIRVTVELWPCGDRTRSRVLARADIANDGTGSRSRGNYRVRLYDRAGRPWREGRVRGFPRTRLLAWDLLHRALTACGLDDRD